MICSEGAYYGVLGEGGIYSFESRKAGHFTFPKASLRMGMFERLELTSSHLKRTEHN